MRNLLWLMLFPAVGLWADNAGPGMAVVNVLNAMKAGNCDAVVANVAAGNEQNRTALRQRCQRDSAAVREIFMTVQEFQVQNITIEGDYASVEVEFVRADGSHNDRDIFTAVRIGECWKANFY